MKTDIEIAQEAKLEHIRDVAAGIGICQGRIRLELGSRDDDTKHNK